MTQTFEWHKPLNDTNLAIRGRGLFVLLLCPSRITPCIAFDWRSISRSFDSQTTERFHHRHCRFIFYTTYLNVSRGVTRLYGAQGKKQVWRPMLEPEDFRKQIYCIEKSTCDIVGTFRRPPQSFGAWGIPPRCDPACVAPVYQVERQFDLFSESSHCAARLVFMFSYLGLYSS